MSRAKFEGPAANFNKISCSSVVFISTRTRRKRKEGISFDTLVFWELKKPVTNRVRGNSKAGIRNEFFINFLVLGDPNLLNSYYSTLYIYVANSTVL